jgi:hypothetical protein
MKYSQLIGIVAAIAIIGICYLPWVYVPGVNIMLSGTNGKVDNHLTFGRQIIPHTFLSIVVILFFLIPKVWAKRTNLFIGFIYLSWAIKNYIIFSMCRQGICPEKKVGLYLLLFFAVIVQVCTLLPKITIKQKSS